MNYTIFLTEPRTRYSFSGSNGKNARR